MKIIKAEDTPFDIFGNKISQLMNAYKLYEIVSIDNEGKVTQLKELGFSPYPYYPVLQTEAGNWMIKELSNLKDFGCIEDYKQGVFKESNQKSKITSNRNYRKFESYNLDKKFKIKEDLKFKLTGKKTVNIPTNLILENKEVSFGVEIEMSECFIPEYLRPLLSMHVERDGSINKDRGENRGGPEAVTSVLKGDQGFKDLQDICKELSLRSKLNNECSVHVHVGGDFKFSKESLVYIYLLSLILEDELFSIMPPSRRDNEYCKRLPKISDLKELLKSLKTEESIDAKSTINLISNALYELALENVGEDTELYKDKSKNHPKGGKMNYDKKTIRYCWLNLIPCMFNTRNNGQYTCEYRLHSSSTNFLKIKNWIQICAGITYFAENYSHIIIEKGLNLTLADVINTVFPRSASSLNSYIKDRKTCFSGANAKLKERKEYGKTENKNKVKPIKKLLRKCV